MPVLLRITLVCVVLVAAIFDLRYRRIPNWLSLSGLLLGIGCNDLLLGWPGLRQAGLGVLVAMAVYLPLYAVRGMGAGDVKLMAAVGAITGPGDWFEIFLATAFIGGAASLVVVLSKHRLHQTIVNMRTVLSELMQFRKPSQRDERLDYRHREALRLPHGASIAAGSVLVLLLHLSRSS